MRHRVLVVYSLAAVLCAPASAEVKPSGGTQQSNQSAKQGQASGHQQVSKPAKPKADATTPKHLLGDWNSGLRDRGVDLTLKYEGDVGASVAGGKSHGIDYAQQLELKGKFDLGKIAGAKGLSSTVTLVNRLGQSVSHNHIGDHLFQVEKIYGGTHHAAIHLVDAYLEWKSGNGAFDIAGGRMFVGNDFATSPYYCEFMTTALCAYPGGLALKRGFTTFPNSTWGGRVRVAPSSTWYVEGGAYQVRPKFGGKYGFDWGWSGTTGGYFPLEAGWEPSFGSDKLNGHYKIGFTTDTSNYEDLLYDAHGVPFLISGRPPARHGGRHSAYLLADQMVARNGKGPENGLVLLAGVTASDRTTSKISRYAFVGVRDQGLIASRPDDVAGILVAHAHISDRLTAEQVLSGDSPQTAEWVVEGMYRIAVADGLTISPDIQYLVHPNAQKSIRSALALATRVEINF